MLCRLSRTPCTVTVTHIKHCTRYFAVPSSEAHIFSIMRLATQKPAWPLLAHSTPCPLPGAQRPLLPGAQTPPPGAVVLMQH